MKTHSILTAVLVLAACSLATAAPPLTSHTVARPTAPQQDQASEVAGFAYELHAFNEFNAADEIALKDAFKVDAQTFITERGVVIVNTPAIEVAHLFGVTPVRSAAVLRRDDCCPCHACGTIAEATHQGRESAYAAKLQRRTLADTAAHLRHAPGAVIKSGV